LLIFVGLQPRLPFDFVEATLRRWFTVPGSEGEQRERTTLLNCSTVGYLGHAAAIAAHDKLASLNDVQCPALIVCGAEDVGTDVTAHQVS
jgi:hypothetical protein